MTKRTDKCIAFLFALFLSVLFLLNLFSPDKDFSPGENRYLQTLPSFSFSQLFSGDFTKKAESYCSDQFVGRDRWISLKARTELLQGKHENNGVFLCEGQRLLELFHAPAPAELDRRAAAVNTFAENVSLPVALALIPSSGEIYSDLLPYGAQNDLQKATVETLYSALNTDTVDLFTPLEAHRNEYIFYRTDHHWTSLGALYASEALSDALGIKQDETAYHPRAVSTDFLGTAYSSSGFFWIKPDTIDIYSENDPSVKVTRYDGAASEDTALYIPEMLATKDKYRFFLGGNAPRVVIETGNEDLPSLLIIRDSFADSLVPFLTDHFSSIHLLDLRYYLDSVKDYAEQHEIDRILILYSVEDFCTDKNLTLLTQ